MLIAYPVLFGTGIGLFVAFGFYAAFQLGIRHQLIQTLEHADIQARLAIERVRYAAATEEYPFEVLV
jgi:hypothetical protein